MIKIAPLKHHDKQELEHLIGRCSTSLCNIGSLQQLTDFQLFDCIAKGAFCVEVTVSTRAVLRYHRVSTFLHTLVFELTLLYQGTGAFFIVKGMNRRPKMPYLSAFWRLIPSGKFERTILHFSPEIRALCMRQSKNQRGIKIKCLNLYSFTVDIQV